MARPGLERSEVKTARDALLAEGRHPSVDAVRIELGNTGSKTTIHKYLKELEAEDGGAGKAPVSAALHDLVERLSAQLQTEASIRVEEAQAHSEQLSDSYKAELEAMRQKLDLTRQQLAQTELMLRDERATHTQTRNELQATMIVRSTAEQQVTGLKERLTENEAHRRSLEDKHTHAREALEQHRQSAKELRDQEQRRHDQQVQQLQAETREARQSLVAMRERGEVRAGSLERELMQTRMELAAQERESMLSQKEVRRLQTITDQLSQEKTIWTRERVALEEMANRASDDE